MLVALLTCGQLFGQVYGLWSNNSSVMLTPGITFTHKHAPPSYILIMQVTNEIFDDVHDRIRTSVATSSSRDMSNNQRLRTPAIFPLQFRASLAVLRNSTARQSGEPMI